MSFGLVLGTGFLLLVSLALSAALAVVGTFMGHLLPIPAFLLESVNFLLSFAVITLLFAMIFKVLPETAIAWGDVWVGAGVTALLFTIGKMLIGLYLGKSGVASAYGAAGSLVVVLVWVYYSVQILLLGPNSRTSMPTNTAREVALAPCQSGNDRCCCSSVRVGFSPGEARPQAKSCGKMMINTDSHKGSRVPRLSGGREANRDGPPS